MKYQHETGPIVSSSAGDGRLTLEETMALERWQVAEIEAGLAEADKGDFASGAQIERVIRKYKA
jgi:predicted transcriptional regulator